MNFNLCTNLNGTIIPKSLSIILNLLIAEIYFNNIRYFI